VKSYDAKKLKSSLRESSAEIVLFGAGDVGKLAHLALSRCDVRVSCFCDGRADKLGTAYCGIPVRHPDVLHSTSRDAIVFVCNNYLTSVVSQLEQLGFVNIHHCGPLLAESDFSEGDAGMSLNEIKRKIVWHQEECRKVENSSTDALVLKYVDVVVTEACSMKCIDCANLMQYYSAPKHVNLELLMSTLERLMGCVDRLCEARVLGGEPFMYKSLHHVVEWLTFHESIEKVILYTNATIVPQGKTLSSLKHPKVIVDITNYGSLSRKMESMVDILRSQGIAFLTKIPSWTDSGRIRYRERSEEDLIATFNNCCVNDVLTLLHGRLYRCPFSANGTNLQAIPYDPADVVDLTDPQKDGADLRREVMDLYSVDKAPLTACSYCNGRDYSTPRVEAGRQTKLPLPVLPYSQ
jgi:hypothetical protein